MKKPIDENDITEVYKQGALAGNAVDKYNEIYPDHKVSEAQRSEAVVQAIVKGTEVFSTR